MGKKHSNAVTRNRIRREIRMMIDSVFVFSKSYDYVIMIRANYLVQDYACNLNELNKLVQKICKEVK